MLIKQLQTRRCGVLPGLLSLEHMEAALTEVLEISGFPAKGSPRPGGSELRCFQAGPWGCWADCAPVLVGSAPSGCSSKSPHTAGS